MILEHVRFRTRIPTTFRIARRVGSLKKAELRGAPSHEKQIPRPDRGSPNPPLCKKSLCSKIQPRKKVPPARSRFPRVTPHHAMSCHDRYVRKPCVQKSNPPNKSSPDPMKVPPRHVTSHHVTSLHATPHHVISHHFQSHHVTMTTTKCNGSVWGFCTGIIFIRCHSISFTSH